VDFNLSGEQTLIKDSALRFVADEYSFDKREKLAQTDEGFSRANWAHMAELGWLGMPLPEERGGFGGTPIETMILMEAFGTGIVLEPFVPSVVLGSSALAFGSHGDAHDALLAEAIEGTRLLTLAYAEAGGRYDPAAVRTRARRDGSSFVIDGSKRAVPYGAAADTYVVSVRTSGEDESTAGITLLLVDRDTPGVRRRDYRAVDGSRASDVTFEGVRVGEEAVLGEIDNGLPLLERTLDVGIGAICAEAVGIMSVMHKVTVEYIKQRKQFGVAIGSFQALQHRAVDMFIALEQARSMEVYAAMLLAGDASDAERKRGLSAAKVQIARSGRYVGQQTIQLHGAIAMTEEYMIGHYFKRMSVLELAFGDADFHLKRYVALGRAAAGSAPGRRLAGVAG
jgi:alkylation response protein AidB-like acyl-CoA dehydrogenase